VWLNSQGATGRWFSIHERCAVEVNVSFFTLLCWRQKLARHRDHG